MPNSAAGAKGLTMSNYTLPSPETFDLWRKGEAITSAQLDDLEQFFAAMVKGAEALGPRFDLATTELRAEYDRAYRIKRHREITRNINARRKGER
jgi:hypothetical protein